MIGFSKGHDAIAMKKHGTMIKRGCLLACATLLVSCQAGIPVHPQAKPGSTQESALSRLDATLAGEYDNYEQIQRVHPEVRAGKVIAVPHLWEQLRMLSRDGKASLWLWHLKILDKAHPLDVAWIYLLSAGSATQVTMTPYRAIDPATMKHALSDKPGEFKFVSAQWAELAPCAQSGKWQNGHFSATANVAACSALLPGLGESAALLPLRIAYDSEMLRTSTFADQARGSDAMSDARRVRWFKGWAAINGGGRNAKAGNQDWHMNKGLRVSSEGGHVELHWRDGANSGYSLLLERKNYAERHLDVLQLNVVDDHSGQTIDYVWTDPAANAIGLNLGWLQVALTQSGHP